MDTLGEKVEQAQVIQKLKCGDSKEDVDMRACAGESVASGCA